MGIFKNLAVAVALCSIMGLAGCGGFSSGNSSNTSSQTNTTADFSVVVAPGSATVAKGSTGTLTATVTAQGGFNSAVTLTLYGLPSGVTASFSPKTVTGSGAPVLTLSAATTAASGTYTVTLSASSGTITHNTTFSLAITGTGLTPDFSIATNPNQQAIGIGGTETFNVIVIALNDYTETVNLAATGLPAGMTASFSPASITGSGISTLTITTDSTAVAGAYSLTVAGAGSTVSHSITVGVTVTTTAPPPDFTLTVAPAAQTVGTAQSTSVTISVAPVNGFTGAVSIAASGLPTGMDASCAPGSITTAGSCTLNISTNAAVVAGTYTLTVTGTSGTLTHSGAVTVTVTAPVLTPDFAMSATPSSQTTQAGTGTSFTASIIPLNSFTGVVTLTASGLPTGVTASFLPSTVSGSGNSMLTLTALTSTAAGTYFIGVTGTDGTLVHTMNISLTVTPAAATADFSIGATPSSQSVQAGGATTFSATIAPLNSFTGAVALSTSALPTGVTASFSPASITASGSSTLTLTSTNSTAAGTYVVGLTGTSGALVHSTNVSLIVTASGTTGKNYTTCLDSLGNNQWVPNFQSPLFQTSYKAAMQALIQHVNGASYNSKISYVRIGLGRGGEINLPIGWNDSTTGPCYAGYTTNWKYSAGADTTYTWNAYLQSMLQYEASLGSSKPVLVSLTPVNGSGYKVPDWIAPVALQNGLSYGNQGLEASDITNFAVGTDCGADWCNMFAQSPPPIAELQTLGQSCPAGTTCVDSLSASTGPLDPLLPFAIARGANDLEIYTVDWEIAYDPTNSLYSQVGSAYRSAIQTASASATMQVLFPDPKDTSVATYLMNNPAVTGAVISVDWSDFDLGNGNYDWSITDAAVAPWVAAGKTVALVFQNSTYGGGLCPGTGNGSRGQSGSSNCAMPVWMWTVLQ